jgi:bacterioferritin-associated ferredoxin
MYVCHCKVVTSGMLTEAIEAGARTTKELARRTAAGTVCGRCVSTMAAMVKDHSPRSRWDRLDEGRLDDGYA